MAKALLFDMDGTLVDSTAAVERVWRRHTERWGVNFGAVRHLLHGRRAIEVIRDLLPSGLDPDHEVLKVDRDELFETEGVTAIPGARRLLAALPRDRWALVTSARPDLAVVRMQAAGLPIPDVLVSSVDVTRGKPDPAGYRMAAERLGIAPKNAVVFEDTDVGMAAGRRAGCHVIALATTLPPYALENEDWLPDYAEVTVESMHKEGGVCLRVTG